MSHRKIEYLNDNRIIYRRSPVNDDPTYSTEHFDYYEDGTHEHYHLFNSKSKITSYKSLTWHSLVLCYLNKYDMNTHARIVRFICDKSNGFITFKIGESSIENIIESTFYGGAYAPRNKARKIIFKDFCGLDFKSKMQIVGQLLGKSTTVQGAPAACISRCSVGKVTFTNSLSCSLTGSNTDRARSTL